VRNQLHYLHGRKEDRLSFEDQEALAGALGYRAENSLMATESFLKEYFPHALHVFHFSWNLLEKCLNGKAVFPMDGGRGTPTEIAPGFFLYHGKLSMADPSRFDRNPLYLWGVFETIHRHGMEMEARLKENITEHLDSVGERFRCAEESVKSFLSFFEQPGYLYRVLEIMLETGFLRKFLPEFDQVYCHVQYDRYHIYPVDVHSLYAVRELENLEKKGIRVWHHEGHQACRWILLDYVDVVVHIFLNEVREFYQLEKLWGDAKVEELSDEEEAPLIKPPEGRKGKKQL
jgi:[protein-PII] uridylyltransferase